MLRVAVALQSLGIAHQVLLSSYEKESSLFSVLLFDLQWPEYLTHTIDDVGAWLYLLCGVAILIVALLQAANRNRIQRWLPARLWPAYPLLFLTFWQLLLTAAAWWRDDGYLSVWRPFAEFPSVAIPLVFFSQAVRIALPLALLMLSYQSSDTATTQRWTHRAIWLLRIAASATFLAHGVKCLTGYYEFIDYLLVGSRSLLGWHASEATMRAILKIIGVIDVVVATLMLTTRWRIIAAYMAIWAAIGAGSRVVHYGLGAYHEVLIRSANYCVPLAVLLYWNSYRYMTGDRTDASSPDNNQDAINDPLTDDGGES